MRIMRFSLALGVWVCFLIPSIAAACPQCLASSDQQIVKTYYLSALILSAMPFAIIGGIVGWLYMHKKRVRRGNWGSITKEEQNDDRENR